VFGFRELDRWQVDEGGDAAARRPRYSRQNTW
jgi:hypothetical protein